MNRGIKDITGRYDLSEKDGEEWRDIVGFEGFYKISNYGRVVSLERRVVTKRNYVYHYKKKMMRPHFDEEYVKVQLRTSLGKSKGYRLHRLIAEAFIPNPENLPQVNHVNGNKSDNRIENLEWCTHQHNVDHAIITGLKEIATRRHVTEEQVRQVRVELNNGLTYPQIVKKLNITEAIIGNIKRGNSWYWLK